MKSRIPYGPRLFGRVWTVEASFKQQYVLFEYLEVVKLYYYSCKDTPKCGSFSKLNHNRMIKIRMKNTKIT